MTARIEVGDAREVLAGMAAESVHCVVTSPPYWGLRDYKLPPLVWDGSNSEGCLHEWAAPTEQKRSGGGEREYGSYDSGSGRGPAPTVPTSQFCLYCVAWHGSLGLEPTPELYVEHIVEVFRAVRRVLRKDGTVWLNMGDCYAGGPNGRSAADTKAIGNDDRTFRDKPFGTVGGVLKPKDLVMMPARVALALQADGWWIRSDIIWAKPNPMPESVTDRPTSAHEHVFLLSQSARYFWDAEAVRIPVKQSSIDRLAQNDGNPNWNGDRDRSSTQNPQTLDIRKMIRGGPERAKRDKQRGHSRHHAGFNDRWDQMERDQQIAGGANLRNVWNIATAPYPDAHFATFPPKLVEPCILAGTSAKGCCRECGAPWVRVVERTVTKEGEPYESRMEKEGDHFTPSAQPNRPKSMWQVPARYNLSQSVGKTVGWCPSCECEERDSVRSTVLDPFGGAGTVGLVAERLDRDSILIELSEDYADMARARIRADLGRVESDQAEIHDPGPLFAGAIL